MDTILITGADGFLGSALSVVLSRSFEVIGLVRNRGKLARLQPSATITVIDERSGELAEACSKARFIIHTATVYGRSNRSIAAMLQTNLLLPLQLLEYAGEGLEAFINTDSFFTKKHTSELYGHLQEYTLSKLQLNSWLERYRTGARIINMRIEHMYGIGDNADKFVPSIIDKLVRNEPSIALTDGLQKRDFVYVDDVVQAFTTVLGNTNTFTPGYHVVEVGSGTAASVRDFVETAKRISGSASSLAFGAVPKQENEFETSSADLTLLSSLGFSPAYTKEKGIQEIINSLK